MGQSRPAKFARPSAAPRIPTPKEVERPIATARLNRYRHRDAIMIRVAYRHGLRVAELCALRWDQVVFGREECDLTGVPTHGAGANIH